ncbi:GNAT family N-acetyltransferase [Metabacillus endolithicus]|uniref:GNAT family N-acetyltransferase n=1 Tax=Metabacillus endolithicus TaxID=1535204 RepID=A0ABW5C0C8_9BACI|nr:GNAT family N-acetyltransferase [Metabacillus endolithicus]UPG65792.1 GNAT family N-acetyltransferase [Metabacillus endolithicus]
MNVELLKNERVEQFVVYCKKHRSLIDDSYLYDGDLNTFEPNDQNPTYVLIDHSDRIVGAASLVLDEYAVKSKKGRFRIFHCELEQKELYQMLLEEILKHTEELAKIFMFVPINNKSLDSCIKGLSFSVERYVFFLVRENTPVSDIYLLDEYVIKPFQHNLDEQKWCDVRNIAFATLTGNETPISPDDVNKMMLSKEHIEGGAMILYHNERPVGVIRGVNDEYERGPIMNIGPIAIIPEYQGKGLGRTLLRAMLLFSQKAKYSRTCLSVNADNERAKLLYVQEDFKEVEGLICYQYKL